MEQGAFGTENRSPGRSSASHTSPSSASPLRRCTRRETLSWCGSTPTTPSPKRASTCATPAPSSRTRCTAGSDRCPRTSAGTGGDTRPTAPSHLDRTVGAPRPHPPMVWMRLTSGGRQGLGLLHEPLPQIPPPPLALPEQGPRAREPELSLRHLKWPFLRGGPASGGEGLSAGPSSPSCPPLRAGSCIAGAYLHCNIRVPALPQPHVVLF